MDRGDVEPDPYHGSMPPNGIRMGPSQLQKKNADNEKFVLSVTYKNFVISSTMATFTIQDRRRGLQYADKVAEIASAAPDPFAKTQTYRMVRTLRKVYGFNDEEKRKYIRGLLKQGCSSYKDLVRESNMPRQEVERVVKTLTAEDPPQVSIALLISTGGREAAFISLIE